MLQLNTHAIAVSVAVMLGSSFLIPSSEARHIPRVTVTEISYLGWPGAYRISNGIVDVVVVPGIGRIMEYEFTGHPETNPLAAEQSMVGVPYSSTLGWVDYGGDKLWPAPQSDWGKHGSKDAEWPPDSAIANGPFYAEPIKNGLRLIGPESVGYAMHAEREIVLKSGSAKLTITDTFVKSRDASAANNGFPLAIWNITRTRPDAVVFAPLSSDSSLNPRGFIALQDSNPQGEPNWSWDSNLLSVVQTPAKSTKVGIDDKDGWIAALYESDVLFSERQRTVPGGPYLDSGTSAQFYTKDSPPFIEMELFGAGVNLNAGERTKRIMTWNLQRLARTPHSPADAKDLVRQAMRP